MRRHVMTGKWTRIGGGTLCLLLLVSCARAPRLRPLAEDAVVVAFGDSLTAGSGAGPGESYPAVLSDLIRRTVINAGVRGEFSGEGLQRLADVLDRHDPSLLILCHGGNDLLSRIDESEVAANVGNMVRQAQERHIDVILIGVPKPGLTMRTAAFYAEIAKELTIPYDGELVTSILSRSPLRSDHIHPNADGYREWAEAVASIIAERGGGVE